MGLTAEEQARLAELEAKFGKKDTKAKGLSPEEQKRFAELDAKFGQKKEERPLAGAMRLMGYDPDASLIDEVKSITPKKVGKSLINTLPEMGAMTGLVASGMNPGGAALGGMGGKYLQNAANQYFFDETPDKGLVADSLEGATRGLGMAMMPTTPEPPIVSAKEKAVREAGERLNVQPTRGMLSDNQSLRKIENSLSQEPNIGGALIRKGQNKVATAIQGSVDDALSSRSGLSEYEAGNEIKSGLLQSLGEEHAPISQVYDDVASSTKDMGLNKLGQTRVARNLRNIDEAQLMPGSAEAKLANEFATGIENAKNVDHLKTLASRAKGILREPGASFQEKQVAKSALEKIDRFETNSIMRNAIEAARTKGEGTTIGKDIVSSLKEAHKKYRDMIEKWQEFGEGSGITKGKYGPAAIAKDIESATAERLPEKIFHVGDNDFLNFLKDKYPEVYNLSKEQKLTEIFKRSMGPDGNVSPAKFFQTIKNYGPEAREHLFGKEMMSRLEDTNTLRQSIPARVGPSGTPEGFSWKYFLHPIDQISGAAKYGVYRGMDAYSKGGNAIANNPDITKMGLILNSKKGLVNDNGSR